MANHLNKEQIRNMNGHSKMSVSMTNSGSNGLKTADSDSKGDPKKTDAESNKEDEGPGDCKSALVQICEETSFQGVPYIVAPTPFPIRRYFECER